MKELKCPHCGQVFKVDEADYASILSQVKNSEFEAEISRRLKELEEKHKAEQDLAAAKNEKSFHLSFPLHLWLCDAVRKLLLSEVQIEKVSHFQRHLR